MSKLRRMNSYYRLLLGLLFLLIFLACKERAKDDIEVIKVSSRTTEENLKNWPAPDSTISGIAMYKEFEDLEPAFHFQNDTTYVINFWATWCKPCLKELPYFEDLDSVYQNEKVKVVLVSLDFPKQIESQLIPYVIKNNLKSKVVVLLDGKYNNWIDRVSPEWSGAIPTTYIYNKEMKRLMETSFKSTAEIIKVIDPFL